MIRRTKFTALSTTPTSMLTRSSFQKTLAKSLSWISPTAMPRMTRVLLWLPAFPPVSVSMGIKVTSRGMAAKAASYWPRMPPVIMPEIIRTSSHRMRCLAKDSTLVLR